MRGYWKFTLYSWGGEVRRQANNDSHSLVWFGPLSRYSISHIKSDVTITWTSVAQSVYWLGYVFDQRDSIPGRGGIFFSSPLRSDLFWSLSSLLSNGYQGTLSSGLKQPECEADHSPLSSVTVKNALKYTSTPQYIFTASCLIKQWILLYGKSRDRSVGIALGYGLDDWGSKVRFPARAGNYSLHHRVQNGSGAHPASYPMGTKGSFPGG
jgi:hypothetical protein